MKSVPPQPSSFADRFVIGAVVSALLIAGMAYLRLVIYPTEVVPLTYALPLLIALWHRNLKLLWIMAGCFLAITILKTLRLLPEASMPVHTRLIFAGMQVVNIVMPAAVLHGIIVLMSRITTSNASLSQSNTELEASNEELAAREEEISQQNEELQRQAEELEQQTEELSAQTEDLQSLNEVLAVRERTLADLVEVSTYGGSEQETLQRLGEAIARLFAPRAQAAAVLEPNGTEMRVLPLFGIQPDDRPLQRDRTMSELVVSRDRAGFLADSGMRPDLDYPKLANGSRVRSLLAAPIRSMGNGASLSRGALEIYGADAGEWSEQELRLAQWAADQIGRTWANARLRQELDDQRRLVQTVVENSSTALLLVDLSGRCTYANPATLMLTGFTMEELAAGPLQDLLKAEPDTAGTSWMSGACTLQRKSGERFHAECLNTPTQQGVKQSGIVLEIRDMTEIHRVAAEREQLLDSERSARGAAERASRAKDEFVATLSHELRTPLNAILGWATILRKSQGVEGDAAKGIEVIERNARLQGQLISDLLDMSKIIAGKVRLEVQALDLQLVIEGALDAVKPAAEAKGIRLEKLLEPVDRMVTGDPNRLQQVVWNLLTNAVKFTPKGGSVSVTLSRVASYVQITVRDSGQGITEDVLPHIFERYRQADSSLSRYQGGLGLGLAIVKHLVELHGGTVHARSEGAGKGSIFSVLLPVRAVELANHMDGEPHPVSHSAMQLDQNAPSLSGLTILVVDDENDARDLISRVLADQGARVLTASSGEEALSIVDQSPLNVLVSDIGMPGMDGYTLIRRIRAEKRRGSTELPAIALTAFARSEDRTKALLAGFQSHISKPVEAVELLATVASVTPRNAAAQASRSGVS